MKNQNVMKALRLGGYGERASVEEVAVPAPAAGEVLVRVRAAAMNPLDAKLARGEVRAFFPLAFPYALGTDLAGVVEQVGAGVTGFGAGDRVVARLDPLRGGAFAEWAAVPATQLARLPEELSFDEAAALATVAATAWQALFETAKLTADGRALVIGAAGSVGSLAVALVEAVGARAIGVVRPARGAAAVVTAERGERAARRITTPRELSADEAVDVIVDTVGGAAQESWTPALRPGGLYVAIAAPPDEAAAAARGVRAAFVFHQSDATRLALATSFCAARGLRVRAERVAPLVEGAAAFAELVDGRARGKGLLRM